MRLQSEPEATSEALLAVAEAKACKNCRFFRPRYQGVGECTRDVGQNSPFWIDVQNAHLLVIARFVCSEFTQQSDDISADTL